MPELLDSPLGPVAVGVVALALLVFVARKLLSRPKKSAYYVRVRCRDCGWKGQVGKFNQRCNACASVSVEVLEG